MIKPNDIFKTIKVEQINWPDAYPYKPEVSFEYHAKDDILNIRFEVTEQSVKAEECIPGKPVYKDSCVEFFIQPLESDNHYYNFEWNAIGNLDLSYRTGRTDPEDAPEEVLKLVKAQSSLGCKPFTERFGLCHWMLEIQIPIAALWKSGLTTWNGMNARCNIYKCGDMLKVPHFVSYAPIDTPEPDFHRPEYFIKIVF